MAWETKKLGTLAHISRGSSPRPISDTKYFEGGTIPWIKIADATKSGKFLYETKEHVNNYGASFSKKLPPGTILVAASGTLGYTQILGVEGCAHDGWLILQNLNGLDRDFTYYALKTLEQHFYNSAYGAAIQNINTEILRETEFPAPPLAIQRRIAGILSAYDDLIENCQRRVQILEEMARSLYREWFVNFRYPGHESVPLVTSALGEIPQGWEVKKLGDISSYISRGISPRYDDEGTSLVLNQKCVREQRLSLEPARRQSRPIPKEKLVQFGDVLINSTGVGTLGRVAQIHETIESCTVDSHVTIARASGGTDLDFYGACLLRLQSTFERLGVGATGQTELGRSAISDLEVVVPTEELQRQFGKVSRGMRSAAKVLGSQIQNLRQTRDLLLPRLMSGQLEVTVD